MSNDTLAFCFGVHNHQPIGNFEHVMVEATERAYQPFLERVQARPEVRLTVHCTGSLLEWLQAHAPRAFDLLGTVVARGQVELLTGGFYEPILAVLPDHDKRGQIERLTDFLKTRFGVRPRGMWLAERVWEPHLPRILRDAGVEYVLVDDRHFALAGLDVETLGGYYLTEDQGAVLGVFPISQRLRYLVPFADVQATVDYLAGRRGRLSTLTLVDDGEKFGVWPGTFAHVYEEGWLDRFFDRLLGTSWITLATFGDVVDREPASGCVYLPTASYRELGEWALPVSAGRALEAAKRELEPLTGGERLVGLLRGGFWRGFLVKYPEVADCHWKMLRLSRAIQTARERDPENGQMDAAQTALWRGQANDAYWHGIFGGCYLPHLRRAVKGALLEAERRLAEATGEGPVSWRRGDENGDGREEVVVRTRTLAVTVNPGLGGMLTEIGYLPKALDVADVLARRPETYHDQLRAPATGPAGGVRTIHDAPAAKEAGLATLLRYDALRRGSLIEGLFEPEGAIDPVAPWSAARFVLGNARLRCAVEDAAGGVTIVLTPDAGDAPSLGLEKRVAVRDATVEAHYRLAAPEGRPPAARWAVQWNLALTAGDAPGRYLTLAGRPSLGSAGRVDGATEVTLVDEWIGVEARLRWSPAASLGWGPVETVSVSEGGYERVYQGLALTVVWRLEPVAAGEWTLATSLTMASR